MSKHLDLGCGDCPRNPFYATEVIGVEVSDLNNYFQHDSDTRGMCIVKASLLERLPFPDSSFSSVSAYDVIEHIPRSTIDQQGFPKYPFIELMNEVWRVLENGGTFIASSPSYPHKSVFQDPTHVNFITEDTHRYFVGDSPYARRYGFLGCFSEKFVGWDAPKNAHVPSQPHVRRLVRNIEHSLFRGGISHITWRFTAIK